MRELFNTATFSSSHHHHRNREECHLIICKRIKKMSSSSSAAAASSLPIEPAELISDPYFDRSNYINAEVSYQQGIILDKIEHQRENNSDNNDIENQRMPIAYNSWRDPNDPRYPLLHVEDTNNNILREMIEDDIPRTRITNEEFLWLCICFRIFILLLIIVIIVVFACL